MKSINLYSFALNIIKSCKMIEVNQKFYTPPPTVFFPALTVLSGYRGGKCIRSDPG